MASSSQPPACPTSRWSKPDGEPHRTIGVSRQRALQVPLIRPSRRAFVQDDGGHEGLNGTNLADALAERDQQFLRRGLDRRLPSSSTLLVACTTGFDDLPRIGVSQFTVLTELHVLCICVSGDINNRICRGLRDVQPEPVLETRICEA